MFSTLVSLWRVLFPYGLDCASWTSRQSAAGLRLKVSVEECQERRFDAGIRAGSIVFHDGVLQVPFFGVDGSGW